MAILATKKVLTLDYWKSASKLEVGDYVFDQNGEPVQVKLVQHYFADECYEIQFNDNLDASGDKHLTLHLEDVKHRKLIWKYKQVKQFRRKLKVFTAPQIAELPLRDKYNRSLWSLQTTKPIKLPHQDLPVPPFIFGFWLVNHVSQNKMTGLPTRHPVVVAKFKDHGYKIKSSRDYFSVTPSIESQLAPNIPTGLPIRYLMASDEQRIELLRGILYAKQRQYNARLDTFRITDMNFQKIMQFQQLVESLGMKTKVLQHTILKNYTLFFKSKLQLVENQNSPPLKVHHARRYITKVTKIAPQMCVHIETTGQNNIILVGEGFIPCH